MKIETQDRVPNDVHHFVDLKGQEDTKPINLKGQEDTKEIHKDQSSNKLDRKVI